MSPPLLQTQQQQQQQQQQQDEQDHDYIHANRLSRDRGSVGCHIHPPRRQRKLVVKITNRTWET
jgi:hypothetical protein